MISIIVCSINIKYYNQLKKNIEETIGEVEYEIIRIDNLKEKLSIAKAYNKGINKSIYAFVIFVHEDVLFHVKHWGNIILDIFNSNRKIGLIGVGGTKMKTRMPSAWWNCEEKDKVFNIIQHIPNKEKDFWHQGFDSKTEENVVIIDGVFMVWRKMKGVLFNENLTGFHNYDLNLSFECRKKNYQIVVTNQILIEHFSLGTLNEFWLRSTIKLHQLYKNELPIYNSKIQNKFYNRKLEFNNGSWFVNNLVHQGMYKAGFNIWLKLLIIEPFSKYHLIFLKKILYYLLSVSKEKMNQYSSNFFR